MKAGGSGITSNLSNSDTPGHGNFIVVSQDTSHDWRSGHNADLWQGVSGVNNPCPHGFCLSTYEEIRNEYRIMRDLPQVDRILYPVTFPDAGWRSALDGKVIEAGKEGGYWTGTSYEKNASAAVFMLKRYYPTAANYGFRATGYSVRCIKD